MMNFLISMKAFCDNIIVCVEYAIGVPLWNNWNKALALVVLFIVLNVFWKCDSCPVCKQITG